MKNIVLLFFLNVFLLIITSCSSTKNGVTSNTIKKPEFEIDNEVYLPILKSERKTFFKTNASEDKWVDSLYSQMTLDEKVGQLFMVAAYSNKDSLHINELDKLIKNYKIGGLIFFQGGPVRQANLTNRFQSKSKIPLFIGIDAEWGLNMRLDSTYKFPWNMTMGAIRDLKLIEKVGRQMGKESKRMGIQFNFVPVLDINTNPKNPIIGSRSFGEDKKNVTEKAIALMTGVQSEGVFSTGKHFPGHGDTSTDSHYVLPTIPFSKQRIDAVELYPYKRMFDEGLESVMVAHLNVPSLESKQDLPSSLSYKIVTNLLQHDLGFEGLIFTDALNMKGANSYKTPGEIDLEAFLAGNDILLFVENVAAAQQKIIEAYQIGIISESRLEKSVRKILHYKYKSGLNNYKPIVIQDLIANINPPENDALQYQLYENAVTVLKNEGDILPIKELDKKIAYVKLGDDNNNSFVNTLKKYTEVKEVYANDIDSLNQELAKYDIVIVGFHKSDKAWKKYDFTDAELLKLQQIAQKNKVILDVFAKPYALLNVTSFDNIEGVVVSYQNNSIAQEVSAELLFGAIEAKGKLPVSINDHFKVNDGLTTQKQNVLGFDAPENVGMSGVKLNEIEQIAQKAINNSITPGMQILVARKGKVIYQKSFGYHTYEKTTQVQNTDLYDIASVTKIVATLPNIMQLYDQKVVGLETRLEEMLPIFKDTNKSNISFKELASHYGRLQPWIPFYKETLDSNKIPLEKYYRKSLSEQFSKQVSTDLFIRNDYHDTIMKQIANSKLLDIKQYKYSDFTFIILKEYLEKITGKTIDQLSQENFFSPLGMNNTLYNPLQKFSPNVIPPTEVDTYFRHALIQGYVHDMTAAMEGGVAGHAGIFSNAMDLAKMMQLFLQKGNYGNHQYFSEKTFDTFNTCYFCVEGNRRGLGFDKPQLGNEGPTCGCVSKYSFGHTGFTGTMVWADPESEIIYIFLSNRTYPDSNLPNLLSKENIRENIQRIIQESILDK